MKPVDFSLQEIRNRTEDSIQASKRAKEAGFDAVEFHLAFNIFIYFSRFSLSEGNSPH